MWISAAGALSHRLAFPTSCMIVGNGGNAFERVEYGYDGPADCLLGPATPCGCAIARIERIEGSTPKITSIGDKESRLLALLDRREWLDKSLDSRLAFPTSCMIVGNGGNAFERVEYGYDLNTEVCGSVPQGHCLIAG
jgi:hypothetical protein